MQPEASLEQHIAWLSTATGSDPAIRLAHNPRAVLAQRERNAKSSESGATALPRAYTLCRRRYAAYALVFACIEHGEWADVIRWDDDGATFLVHSMEVLTARLQPLFTWMQLGNFITWVRRNTRRAQPPRIKIDGVWWTRKTNRNAPTFHSGMCIANVRRFECDEASRTQTNKNEDAASPIAMDNDRESEWARVMNAIASTYDAGKSYMVCSSQTPTGSSERPPYRCGVCGAAKRGHRCTARTRILDDVGYDDAVLRSLRTSVRGVTKDSAPTDSTNDTCEPMGSGACNS